jgi:hypothetical protein
MNGIMRLCPFSSCFLTGLVSLLATVAPLAGQEVRSPETAPSSFSPALLWHAGSDPVPERPNYPAMAAAGLLGGAVGAAAGGLVTAVVFDSPYGGAVIGGLLGEGLLLRLGVHLANRGRGDYTTGLIPTLAMGYAGFLAAYAAPEEIRPAVVLAIPVSQLFFSIRGELRARP